MGFGIRFSIFRLGLVLGALALWSGVSGQEAGTPGTVSTPWIRKPDSGNFFLYMIKSKNELSVRSFDKGEVIKVYRAISGTNAGDKEKEGDKKTPEGIYFIERRIPKSRLIALHGSAAFELNYPNPIDRILKRTGNGIWIHGVDNEGRMKKSFDTLGCVAVSNSDVLDLAEVLTFKDIPIVILDQEKPELRSGLEAAEGPLRQRVIDWSKAWSSMDVNSYLSFYGPDFQSRGMNFDQWKVYKSRLAKIYKRIQVTVEDLKILQHGKYSVAIFKQTYESDRIRSIARKRLYLVGEGASATILAEEAIDDVFDPQSKIETSLITQGAEGLSPTPTEMAPNGGSSTSRGSPLSTEKSL